MLRWWIKKTVSDYMSIVHALKPSRMAQAVMLLTYKMRGSLVWALSVHRILWQYASLSPSKNCRGKICNYVQPLPSVAGISTRLGVGLSGVRIQVQARNFSITWKVHGGQFSLLFNGCRSFQGLKWSGREAIHSSPSSIEVKNKCSYTSTHCNSAKSRQGQIHHLPYYHFPSHPIQFIIH